MYPLGSRQIKVRVGGTVSVVRIEITCMQTEELHDQVPSNATLLCFITIYINKVTWTGGVVVMISNNRLILFSTLSHRGCIV